MGLRSSSLAKKNDDTLTWVLHRRDLCQQEPDQKPHETYKCTLTLKHKVLLQCKSSIGRPGNIPMVLCTGCLLYQTQLDDHYQTEVALPLGMVVNAVFKNEQWLYVQTPHAEEGYIPYGSCLPLGIVPPPDAARAPCWETQSDVFPRPVGDRRRRGRGHRSGSVGGFGNGGSSVVDDYDDDDQDVATLLFRRRHCERDHQSSPPPPLRRPSAATRSITSYGYL
ncbi:PREDICTED: uncharacterized protein LOC107170030 [Diuraphis noxia]|uniref:uncharacterized protein LOC107170030 n=1 Tax=Diuraphis noxia TaxID=143948 RepID=UPI0007636875|nr:PREDICTED: uncharacterized protein LOC107170030 [Diuraphis noxia]